MVDDDALTRITDANLAYEGSISIDPKLIEQAGLHPVQVMSEMVSNWGEGAGLQIMPVLGELYADLG